MRLTMYAMKTLMFKISRSKHDFEQTVKMIRDSAIRVGWDVPWRFELQQHYCETGLSDMTKAVNVYLCNPKGGYDIMKSDVYKPMAVMMPTAVSIYETNAAEIHVSRMNLGRMSLMFGGRVKEALRDGGANLERALEGIIES
ncbi:MAG: DUF302 domain-containing protein [bacterium]|nr:DUF302 domain-containing protein [bacterium]